MVEAQEKLEPGQGSCLIFHEHLPRPATRTGQAGEGETANDSTTHEVLLTREQGGQGCKGTEGTGQRVISELLLGC